MPTKSKIVVSSDSSSEPLRQAGDRLSLSFYPERLGARICVGFYLLLLLGLPAATIRYYFQLTALRSARERAHPAIAQPPKDPIGGGALLLLIYGPILFIFGGRVFRYHFRRPAPAGTSVELTASELSYRETLWEDRQATGAVWCDREYRWDRGDIQHIREARVGRVSGERVGRGVEIVPHKTSPYTICLGGGLSQEDTAALLTLLHSAWPETDPTKVTDTPR